MKITELEIPGVLLIEPQYFEDERGYYVESYSKKTLQKFDINFDFIQDNHSFTKNKGTLRGIHFQNNPKAQTKLIRCTNGKVLDVVVDLRKASKTFKKWIGTELSAENRKQILIPKGFGHGFLTLEDNCSMQYKVDEFYDNSLDRAIKWNDPEINIDWGTADVFASLKDVKAPCLKDSDVNF